jgi:hypothetical protein
MEMGLTALEMGSTALEMGPLLPETTAEPLPQTKGVPLPETGLEIGESMMNLTFILFGMKELCCCYRT